MVIFWISIALAALTIVGVILLDDWDILPWGIIIAGVLCGGSLSSRGIEYSSKVIYMNRLIEVNGYYVDPIGNFVTEDNRHGHIDLNIIGGLPVASTKTIPTLIESETFYKHNWYAFKDQTERTQEISMESF